MELRDYLSVLRRSWRSVLACTLLGTALAAMVTFTSQPIYAAQTQLFVAIQGTGSVQELQQGNTFSQARVQSYIETVDTPKVLLPAIESLGLHATASDVAKQVEATADLNTVIITITAEDSSPVQAAALAQAVGDSLVRAVDELESPSEGGTSPVKLSVITPASAPSAPDSPNVALNIVLGTLVGLIAGVAFSILRAVLDTKVRGEADFRRISDAPVLGGISFESDAMRKPLLTQASQQSPRAESFRQLRTNLQFAHVSHESRAILVTSSLPGEGKTTTATNLAIAIAQSGKSVVLIDADLRRPRINEYLGLERNAGLTTALIGRADIDDLLQPWGEDQLHVLTSGQIPPNPSELLGSTAMKQLIATLEKTYDAVIIDAPPLLPVTDAAVLAQQVGGVVLVVGSTKVNRADLEKSLSALDLVEADLLGVVLNWLPVKGPDAYAHSYYSYESLPAKPGSHFQSSPAKSSMKPKEDAFDRRVLRGSADR